MLMVRKSKKIHKKLFSSLEHRSILMIVTYNKLLQTMPTIDINSHKKEARIYRINLNHDEKKLIFEGQMIIRKRVGFGKEYNHGK